MTASAFRLPNNNDGAEVVQIAAETALAYVWGQTRLGIGKARLMGILWSMRMQDSMSVTLKSDKWRRALHDRINHPYMTLKSVNCSANAFSFVFSLGGVSHARSRGQSI